MQHRGQQDTPPMSAGTTWLLDAGEGQAAGQARSTLQPTRRVGDMLPNVRRASMQLKSDHSALPSQADTQALQISTASESPVAVERRTMHTSLPHTDLGGPLIAVTGSLRSQLLPSVPGVTMQARDLALAWGCDPMLNQDWADRVEAAVSAVIQRMQDPVHGHYTHQPLAGLLHSAHVPGESRPAAPSSSQQTAVSSSATSANPASLRTPSTTASVVPNVTGTPPLPPWNSSTAVGTANGSISSTQPAPTPARGSYRAPAVVAQQGETSTADNGEVAGSSSASLKNAKARKAGAMRNLLGIGARPSPPSNSGAVQNGGQSSSPQLQAMISNELEEANKKYPRQHDFIADGTELGRGSFGVVHKVTYENGILARKCIPINNETPLKDALTEIRFENLSSPYVVKYRGFYVENDKLYILFEFCSGGSIESFITNQARNRPGKRSQVPAVGSEQILRTWAKQIVLGLEYLQMCGIVHLDLKPANVLFHEDGHTKIADFGISAYLQEVAGQHAKTVGTPEYMAPEALRNKPSFKSDIWSLGCTVYHMVMGKSPLAFPEDDNEVIHLSGTIQQRVENAKGGAMKIGRLLAGHGMKKPDLRELDLSDLDKEIEDERRRYGESAKFVCLQEARDFILKCCAYNPEDRPDASDLKQHPFVGKAKDRPAQSSRQGTEQCFHVHIMHAAPVVLEKAPVLRSRVRHASPVLGKGEEQEIGQGTRLMPLVWQDNQVDQCFESITQFLQDASKERLPFLFTGEPLALSAFDNLFRSREKSPHILVLSGQELKPEAEGSEAIDQLLQSASQRFQAICLEDNEGKYTTPRRIESIFPPLVVICLGGKAHKASRYFADCCSKFPVISCETMAPGMGRLLCAHVIKELVKNRPDSISLTELVQHAIDSAVSVAGDFISHAVSVKIMGQREEISVSEQSQEATQFGTDVVHTFSDLAQSMLGHMTKRPPIKGPIQLTANDQEVFGRSKEAHSILSKILSKNVKVTFVHGPEGFGKSMIVKLVANYAYRRGNFRGGVFVASLKNGEELRDTIPNTSEMIWSEIERVFSNAGGQSVDDLQAVDDSRSRGSAARPSSSAGGNGSARSKVLEQRFRDALLILQHANLKHWEELLSVMSALTHDSTSRTKLKIVVITNDRFDHKEHEISDSATVTDSAKLTPARLPPQLASMCATVQLGFLSHWAAIQLVLKVADHLTLDEAKSAVGMFGTNPSMLYQLAVSLKTSGRRPADLKNSDRMEGAGGKEMLTGMLYSLFDDALASFSLQEQQSLAVMTILPNQFDLASATAVVDMPAKFVRNLILDLESKGIVQLAGKDNNFEISEFGKQRARELRDKLEMPQNMQEELPHKRLHAHCMKVLQAADDTYLIMGDISKYREQSTLIEYVMDISVGRDYLDVLVTGRNVFRSVRQPVERRHKLEQYNVHADQCSLTKAIVHCEIGYCLLEEDWNLRDAKVHFKNAISTLAKDQRQESAEILEVLVYLAQTYDRLGQSDNSKKFLKSAEQIAKSNLKTPQISSGREFKILQHRIAQVYNALCTWNFLNVRHVHSKREQRQLLDLAQHYGHKCLDLRETFGDSTTIHAAQGYHNLGFVLSNRSEENRKQAIAYLIKAVEIRSRVLGRTNSITLRSKQALAGVYKSDPGELGMSADLLKEILDVRRSTFPAGHPEIAKVEQDLIDILRSLATTFTDQSARRNKYSDIIAIIDQGLGDCEGYSSQTTRADNGLDSNDDVLPRRAASNGGNPEQLSERRRELWRKKRIVLAERGEAEDLNEGERIADEHGYDRLKHVKFYELNSQLFHRTSHLHKMSAEKLKRKFLDPTIGHIVKKFKGVQVRATPSTSWGEKFKIRDKNAPPLRFMVAGEMKTSVSDAYDAVVVEVERKVRELCAGAQTSPHVRAREAREANAHIEPDAFSLTPQSDRSANTPSANTMSHIMYESSEPSDDNSDPEMDEMNGSQTYENGFSEPTSATGEELGPDENRPPSRSISRQPSSGGGGSGNRASSRRQQDSGSSGGRPAGMGRASSTGGGNIRRKRSSDALRREYVYADDEDELEQF